MGWALKTAIRCVAAILAIPILLAGAVLLGANTDPGRHLIESLTGRVTGGMVRIEGFSGNFPGTIRIARLTVADAAGPYLTVEDATLDWSPARLLDGEALINLLEAGRVTLTRLPATDPDAAGKGGETTLPVRVSLRQLRVARIDIGAAVAGQPVALTLDGAAEIASERSGQVTLAITTATPRDRYMVEASIDASHLSAKLDIEEAAHGLIAGLAGLPDLGAISIGASIDGPMRALGVKVSIAAGPLRASAHGTVDAEGQAANLTVSASAPAMQPAPGIGWSSIELQGQVHGPFTAPDAAGTLTIVSLTAAGASVDKLQANVSGGMGGPVELHASAGGLRLPGPDPALFAGAPLELDATAALDKPDRPVRFTVRHPLLSAEGTAETGPAQKLRVRLTVPDLAPFAAPGGVELQGRAALDLDAAVNDGTITLAAKGTMGITGGLAQAKGLVGDAGTIEAVASLRGNDVHLTRLVVNSQNFELSASGQLAANQLGLDWTLRLADLSAVQPTVSGTVEARGHIGGPLESVTVTSDLTADVAAAGFKSGRVTAQFTASGLPGVPVARLTASGSLLNAPLTVAIAAERRDNIIHLTIGKADWKSLTASGSLDMAADAALPVGQIRLAMANLGDLTPLTGQRIGGSVEASVEADAGSARINAVVRRAAMTGTAEVAEAALHVTVTDPADRLEIDGTLKLDGIAASGMRGSAQLTARGPLNAMALHLVAGAAEVMGQPARLETSATLNASDRVLTLAALQGTWKSETIRLAAPARIGFAGDVTIDRLRLALRKAELEVDGRAGATLDLRVKLQNLPAGIAAVAAPEFAADGTISGEARLTGPAARPEGTIRVNASRLHMRTGPGQTLPPADLAMAAALSGGAARLDGRLTAGVSNVTLGGTAPLDAAGRMDLRVGGMLDLAMLRPLLAASGRSVGGRLALDMTIGGTPAAPDARGTARLSGVDVQDASLGAHVSDIAATVQADGEVIRLTQFTGKAGPGTIAGSGSFGLTAPRPVNLTLRAANARLISNDLITSLADANLAVSGALSGGMTLSGTVRVRRADITVPEKLPPTIAVLEVREAGKPWVKPPPPPPPPEIGLNLTLDAPREIFIRGRGLDVELGGRVVFGGKASDPLPQGELKLRRGSVSLAGQSLTLTEGTVAFAGAPVTDPSLKLVASSVTAAMTSTLTVSGSARDPKITLSSVPDMPEDEILAQLLFHTVRSKLSPFQVAQLAAALASLSGVSSPIGDPFERVRSALGLDRLSVGSGANGGATLEAGRYVAPGVQIGAKQSATGGGTQATVQIDIAKGLKLETTAGTGSTSATGGASGGNGASVGVTYQFEY